jgi:type I restriction enzyme M protein
VIYDLRTNKHFTPQDQTAQREDLQDFIDCYHPANRLKRKETERFNTSTATP